MASNKGLLSKISPMDETESYFCEAFNKIKILDKRGLAYAMANENTLYSEAFALAQSAIDWLNELEYNYRIFESKADYVTKTEEEKFLSYCAKKKWSVKKTAKDIIARDKSKFRAKFELDTNEVYMVVDKNPLIRIQLINELES